MRLVDDPCDTITGPAREMCQSGGGTNGGGGGATDPGSTGEASLDPLTSLAKSCAKAAAWVAREVGDLLVGGGPAVDLTAGGFVRQYALVFAASTVLVLVLWLLGVAKRAVRGVPFTTALGEAIGLLWLAVAVSAFAPLALYTVIQATSAVSAVLATATGQEADTVFDALAAALINGEVGGGPIMLIVASLVVMLLCGAIGLLMVVRALGLYVGALFGVPIFSGLVDRDLWVHTRKWSGWMASVIAIEPALIIVIGLAAAVQADGEVVTGIGITAIACAVTIALIAKTPGWGDSIRIARMVGKGMGGAVTAAVGSNSAAGGVRAGITTHSTRDASTASRPRVNGTNRTDSTSGGITGGLGADSKRTPKKPPKRRED